MRHLESPRTTRDAIDVPFEVKRESGDGGVAATEKYILIDTAGMRKSRRVDDSIEFFSVQRSEDSIARSDITVLVLDAEGLVRVRAAGAPRKADVIAALGGFL